MCDGIYWYIVNQLYQYSQEKNPCNFLAVVYYALHIIAFSNLFTNEARNVYILTGLQAQKSIHSCRRSNAVNSEKLLEDDLRAQLCSGGDDIRFN